MSPDIKNKLGFHRHRNHPAFLMASLFVLLLLFPLLEDLTYASLILGGLYSFVLLSSTLAVWSQRRMFVIICSVGIPWILLVWVSHVFQREYKHFDKQFHLDVIQAGLLITFFFIVTYAQIKSIMTTWQVTGKTLCRAVSGYLLLGITWAAIYELVYTIFPNAYMFPEEHLGTSSERWNVFVYYSFVTMNTIGYGDIIPVSPFARSLANIEGVLGPMYLTILIARLVALYTHNCIQQQAQSAQADDDQSDAENPGP